MTIFTFFYTLHSPFPLPQVHNRSCFTILVLKFLKHNSQAYIFLWKVKENFEQIPVHNTHKVRTVIVIALNNKILALEELIPFHLLSVPAS
jgi:hypothetical protein